MAAKKMTMGVIVGNRGFFPDHLAKSGREEIIRALGATGEEIVPAAKNETALIPAIMFLMVDENGAISSKPVTPEAISNKPGQRGKILQLSDVHRAPPEACRRGVGRLTRRGADELPCRAAQFPVWRTDCQVHGREPGGGGASGKHQSPAVSVPYGVQRKVAKPPAPPGKSSIEDLTRRA